MQYSPELYRFVMKNAALIEEARQMLEDEDAQQCVPKSYALVSRNRRLIEDAYAVLDDIDAKLLLALNEYIKSYPKIDNDAFFYKTYGRRIKSIVFGKNKWKIDLKRKYPEFAFWLGSEGGNNRYASWLSYLTGQTSGGRTGFYFWINHVKFLPRAQGIAFLQEKLPMIKKDVSNKFYLEDGNSSVGYPLSLNIQDLIAGIPEHDSDGFFKNKRCFTSIKEALDTILSGMRVFDRLTEDVKQKVANSAK